MKILFLTSGRNVPSSRFRVHPFVPLLEQRGHRCVVAPSRPEKYEHWSWLGWRLSIRGRIWLRELDCLLARWRRFDVVFLERELFDDPTWELETKFRQVAPRFVLDIDDGIFLTHPEKFARIASMADVVIAGSEALAAKAREYARRSVIIPSCVSLARYPFYAHRDGPPVIGWMGTRSNLPFLEILREPLERLATRHQFEWHVATNANALGAVPRFQNVNTRAIPWSDEQEVRILQRFQIGVMPLQDTAWTRYKCGLKLIQYMATGAVAVASPVGVNAEILSDGAGLLASDAATWESHLERLLDDPMSRAQLAEKARKRVERKYSVESVFPSWRDAVLGGC